MTTAYLHSIETMGTLDGPGVRTLIFLQGCPLRCVYCHNPDSQAFTSDKTITTDEVLRLAHRYKTYYGKDGGLTFSGGEPLAQPDFLETTLKRLKEEGFNTCIDTSGVASPETVRRVLPWVDTILLDIKAMTPAEHLRITGTAIHPVDRFMATVKAMPYEGRIWVRHVMMPGVTDHEAAMDQLAERIEPLRRWIDKTQILPYHTMGSDKYAALGRENPLEGMPPMDKARAAELQAYLEARFFGTEAPHD